MKATRGYGEGHQRSWFRSPKKDSKIEVDIDSIEGKLKICYVRVSSVGQKDDLERQKNMMVSKYPSYIIIEDIGSGLNLNKRY